MRVILVAAVPGLGQSGDVVDVQAGYFRNFLAPRRLATVATPEAVALRADRQAAARRRQSRIAEEQANLRTALSQSRLTVRERAEHGQLFGSVTASRLSQLAREQLGLAVPTEAFRLDHPLRTVGTHTVPVRLGQAVASLTVVILDAAP